jgi:capsular polysaccharide biosynthesis protein
MASQNELAFRRWWWLVVIAVCIGIAGAFVSLQVVKPEYEASCKLFVAGRPDSGTGEGYQAAQFAQARVAAYLDLLKGARVAQGAINALGLDMPSEDLQGRITATAPAESVIMTVSVVDPQPQRSADLANAVCTSFLSVAADAEGANPLVNTRVIEYANKPVYPIGPSKKRFLTVGALSGLLAGVGLVVMLGRRSPSRGQSPPDALAEGTVHDADSQQPDGKSPAKQSVGNASHRRRDQ